MQTAKEDSKNNKVLERAIITVKFKI